LSLVGTGKTENVRIVGALCVLLLAAGCGTDDDSDAGGGANALRVMRADGSHVKFADEVHAWCTPYRDPDGEQDGDEPMSVVVLGGEAPAPGPGGDATSPFWIVDRAVEDIERSPKLVFPHEEGGHAALFVLDPETEYELSSMEEASTGHLVFEEWGCEKGDAVRVSVDARLESEGFGPTEGPKTVTPVKGEIVAVIGDPIAFPD
jgi:hypothetical protein